MNTKKSYMSFYYFTYFPLEYSGRYMTDSEGNEPSDREVRNNVARF